MRLNIGVWVFGLILLTYTGLHLKAQDPDNAPPPQQAPQLLTADQLDNLVAPIALYPDQLLSQVLVASTHALDVVVAQQWLQANNTLSGPQLLDAARQQNWDPSVQALVAFPDALTKLSQNVQWTTDLGNAFLAQQPDVMSAVQRMRVRAQANGKLSSSPQESVTTDTQDGQPIVQIEPANPDMMYVPSYDPMYVWGPPVWGYYPSLYYPAYGFGWGPGVNVGLWFGSGWNGWGGWGWAPNWHGRTVYVNRGFVGRYGFRPAYRGVAPANRGIYRTVPRYSAPAAPARNFGGAPRNSGGGGGGRSFGGGGHVGGGGHGGGRR